MLQGQLKRGSAGFTLVESMIALGLIGVIVSAVMVYISQSSNQNLYTEVVNSRMNMAQTLARTVGNYDNLIYSTDASASNGMLKICLGITKGTCTATAPEGESFDLYAVKGTVKVGGTKSAPVLYSRVGGPNCAPAAGSEKCPFWETRTSFRAVCPNAAASCGQASTVTVKYEIKPAATRTEFMGKKLSGQEFSVSHRVFKGALKTPQGCETGSQQTGLSKDGLVECVCQPGYTQIGLTPEGQPTCVGQGVMQCKKGEILKGRNPDGSPVCTEVVTKCDWQSFETDSAKCPNAGWMETLDLGKCRPQKKKAKDKSNSRPIQCDANRGYCCWYEEKK